MDKGSENPAFYVALIHHPVVNKKGAAVGSALTTIDLHDIARASKTFGAAAFYVVTPYEDQARLAKEVIEHWTQGAGGKINPYRKEALELIRLAGTFEEARKDIEEKDQRQVVSAATSARNIPGAVDMVSFKKKLETDPASHLLVFGTAWGLTQEMIDACDLVLEPIEGIGDYNHLSVRSAVSIYLDRLINSSR